MGERLLAGLRECGTPRDLGRVGGGRQVSGAFEDQQVVQSGWETTSPGIQEELKLV